MSMINIQAILSGQLQRIKGGVLYRLDNDIQDTAIDNAIYNATNYVLGYTNRSVLLEDMEHIVEELALISLNRLGDEGLVDRVQGDFKVTYSDALPPHLKTLLNSYRLLRRRG